MKNIVYYTIVIMNFICLAILNYLIFENLPFEIEDTLISIALELFIIGNIYISVFKDKHNLSFSKISNIWPFITIKRITLEEREKIRILEKEE